MFKKVETIEDLEIFDTIYRRTCEELDITFYSYRSPCHRYLIMDEDEPIGTVEIVPRNLDDFSIVEDYFAFEHHPLLHKGSKHIYEIGKIGIIPSKRGKDHVIKIVALLYDFILAEEAEQYIALINKTFYRLLMLQFRVRLTRAGDDIALSDSTTVVPIIGDCKKIITSLEKAGYKDKLRDIAFKTNAYV